MPTTREAKYLAPVDFGKTITVTNTKTGKTVTGELVRIDAIGCSPIDLTVIAGKDSGHYLVDRNDEVTITGTDTPPGLNLHQPVTEQHYGGQHG